MQQPSLVRVVAVALAIAAPATPALADTATPCSLAQAALRDALERAGGDVTPDVATRMADVQGACGVPVQTTAPTSTQAYASVLASACAPGSTLSAASGNGWLHGDSLAATLVVDSRDHPRVPAEASYSRAGEVVRYASAGDVYGLTAHSHGGGTVSLYGVSLIATHAQAQAGCAAPGGPLCWGSGYAETSVPADGGLLVHVSVYGGFSEC